MDHLQTRGLRRRRSGRQRNHITGGQSGQNPEGSTVLIVVRGQEARGEHDRRATAQTAQVRRERGHDRPVVATGSDVQRVSTRRNTEVIGQVAIGGIIHQRSDAAGDHVHRRGIGGTVQNRQVHQAGVGATLAGFIRSEEGKSDAATVRVPLERRRVQHPVGDRRIGAALLEGHPHVHQGVGGRTAVAGGDAHVDGGARRGVDKGSGAAEGEVVQQQTAVQIHVHRGGGRIGGVVDHLQTRGLIRRLHALRLGGDRSEHRGQSDQSCETEFHGSLLWLT